MLLVSAQMAWAAVAASRDTRRDARSDGPMYLALATMSLAIALTAGSAWAPALTVPAATVCLLSTFATAVYASTLDGQTWLSRAGYSVSLFSMAACLILLAADIGERACAAETERDEADVYLVVPADRASFYRF